MASRRSSLPSRLRQLLSTEGTIGPSIKLDSEPPLRVKTFVDKVIQCPLQDIAIPLSGFQWEYGKGNFHHWRPLFLHFDTYFKTYISCRNDLLLTDNILDDGPFPKQAVLQILRVMQMILENCHNKSSFSGLEHFKLLLASTDPEILISTLETLSALVKINPSKLHASGKLIGCGAVNSCLLSLAQGWGSKEEGLGLCSCVTANERTLEEGLSLFPPEAQDDSDKTQYFLGSTLYYEMHGANTEPDGSSSASSSTTVVHIPDLHLRKEDDLSIMRWCMDQYNVPLAHRFSLLTRIRYAHAFHSPRVCRLYSKICLLSFIILVQASDSNDELVSYFANEPEYTNELIRIVKFEDTISGGIRTLAMNALGAQLAAYSSSPERARILSGSSISFAGGNRMILLNVLQRAILSLNSPNDPTSVSFVEALLQFYLLHVLSSSSSGSVIRGSGMVPSFLPLLEDSDPTHLHLVCLAVKTLQKLMDYSNAALTLFKDLGGVELLAQRLDIEVHRVIDLAGADGNSMVVGECSRRIDQLGSQKRLIRALLKALGSATYAPANSARSQNAYDLSLPATLSLIFLNVDKFGGDIYSSCVTLMSEIIHKEPTCFPALYEMGLPNAFLSSVLSGIVPSSKALTCVPNGIGAICLNAKGLEAVRGTAVLRFLVDIFTDKKYVMAMNEGIVPLANAVEELLRHVSSLRGTGVELIIEVIDRIASLGDTKFAEPLGKINGSSQMDMDSEDKQNMGPCNLVDPTGSTAEGITDEQFIQLSIFHVMVLVHRTMENTETCRLFVEKSGIEALLRLLLRPSIAQSSEGMSIALHSTLVFKSFTQHHSTSLSRAFCSSLKDYLKKSLTAFRAMTGSFLLDPRETPDSEIFSSLFVVEFLLYLAASKDNRWVTSLLAEFGNGSKDILLDIGNIHREVLWQIALLEDSKVGTEDNDTGSADESQQLELDATDTEEQRLNSFRHLLDPLLRRRMSGLSFESQFLDLMDLYRDLTRASGLQQRQVEGISNLQPGVRDHTEQPESSIAPDSSGRKEEETRRSYYRSCCDMVKSLSVHITHLFQELGKVMLLPSRRRDDMLNVSPSSKSVASTFATVALEHMNFAGHPNPSMPEVSVSSKCRYLGKVIDFIDGILLDKLDSCNPVLLNCMYGRGVIQSVLTTFEATSQLLFAVNRSPASPMETDDGSLRQDRIEEADHSWIYGSLSSYGKLMDHLVTSSFILSPFTKHLLTQPLISGDIPFPRDAETFVKVLQSMILKAVLPVWTHQQFTECNNELIASVISIIRHIYSGVEVKNLPSNVTRISGPPPSESTISTIVEMGFSRPRAEEALRQVGSNSVELAMEWLFSHPEEVPEDDELARALAMSLGNSGLDTNADVPNESTQTIEEEVVQLPPVDDLLSTCRKLLQMKDSLAFPVRSLLVMLCSQNEGQHRSHVISFIIDQVKLCSKLSYNSKDNFLYSLFHVLALILNEDASAREVAAKNGLVNVASDLLSHWNSTSFGQETAQIPKWVTAAFVAIDRLAQVDPKSSIDVSELLKKDEAGIQTSLQIDENRQCKLKETLSLSPKHLDIQEQQRLVEIACGCIRRQLPSESMHAVLQLCSTLTRNHSVAVSFLDAGGLHSLLSLPTSSLFVGFDSIASSIVRHILEDAQTLQQAMEAEIRHSVATVSNRQSSGRLTPRNFLSYLTSVIQRDPVIFLKAAQTVCEIEMVGERPYIVLHKERDKEKSKDGEKDKEKSEDKSQSMDKVGSGHVSRSTSGSGQGKHLDASARNVKVHRKPPHSFINVIELLLDSVLSFDPHFKDEYAMKDGSSPADMDIDISTSKGKGKAVVSSSGKNEFTDQEASASMAKIAFILKILTEILLMYASSIHMLLRKDAEVGNCRVASQRGLTGICSGGIFHHILHKLLPYSKSSRKEKKPDVDWRYKLASRANQFLVAACGRSSEARKRIFAETSFVLNDFVESSHGFRVPVTDVQAVIDLLNDVLSARTPTGSHISAEASVTFVDVDLVHVLNRVLHVLDLDHVDSHKVASGIVKVLELVTKEHVNAAESNIKRDDRLAKSPTNDQSTETDAGGSMSQTAESVPHANSNPLSANNVESFEPAHNCDGSELAPDDMEHDQDTDGGFDVPEDDYMHETSEDARGDEFGIGSVTLEFEIQPDAQENLDEAEDEDDDDEDEDDQMSGDEGDEVDEDDGDDEHNVLEDEGHHLPHADTDQDDNEIDEDEFDDEVMDEEEDDEDEEDGVVLRLGGGMNGINVFDHIEVLGRENSFSGETLHVMPVEVFGSRREGRTTSIYNLLGRNGDSSAPSRHPFLVESSSSSQTGNGRDAHQSRSTERSSPLDSFFQTLRNGRHGHRSNLWASDDQQIGGSSTTSLSPGLEDLLVSHLRRQGPEKPADHGNVVASQNKEEVSPVAGLSGMVTETPAENDGVNQSVEIALPSSSMLNSSVIADILPVAANETTLGADASSGLPQSVEMQYEHNDVVSRDVEAVSQESSGSGATLGESLRSLDVEIGSADGHDDGGERQGPGDGRTRRSGLLFGNGIAVNGRDASLHSVTEVSENPSQESGQGAATEPQPTGDADSGSIDAAFLDALPEELRAEVLSAQQGQAAQPQNAEAQNTGDIDPEFLAALPPDIREEVLAQQRVQRVHQSQELEGQPVEMDTVSIIATFPNELREEVLLTSSDAVLSNLTPALVAEANMLRERFAQRYNRSFFGMHPRNRRGESSRRGEGLDGTNGIVARRSFGSKTTEACGAPLVDTEDLKAMIRLLRIVQPLYKGHLQKLLLNLCAYGETRIALVKILIDMLLLDVRKPGQPSHSADPIYRLYACQSNVTYSRPRYVDGIPPLVSRRVLEILTYLARNHHFVAKMLLECNLLQPVTQETVNQDEKGKAIMIVELEEHQQQQKEKGHVALDLLLSLLNQPLYLRSIAHLEQLLNLLDVIIDNAGSKSNSSDGHVPSGPEQQPAPHVSTSDAELNAASNSPLPEVNGSLETPSSVVEQKSGALLVLLNLPQAELRLLCSLLAKDGLSDNAYTLVAEVMKKLVAIAPVHCHLFITELAYAVRSLIKSAISELHTFCEVEKALLSTTAPDGAAVLRVLQALSSLVAALNEKDRNNPSEEYSRAVFLVSDINTALGPLWLELSTCISQMESYSESASDLILSSTHKPSGMTPLPAGSQNILPYIESFFVMCEKLHPGESVSGHDFGVSAVSDIEVASPSTSQLNTVGPVAKTDGKQMAFLKFSEKHRKLLNAFIRQNPGLLEKSFSLMLKAPRVIDFDNKRAHFRSKIKHQHDHRHNPLRISVRRAYILEDSYNQLRMRTAQELKGRLTVHFQGEEGIDAGGLTREWYQVLSRVVFDKGALLFTTVGNESTFQPNPNSVYQTEHLSYFKFVGRVVGKALFDGQLLDVHFTRSFYKHILGAKVTYHDIEAIDPDYFKNLKWLLENDISDILDLTFSIDADEEKLILYERNEVTDFELIPGGRNIRVTEENKHQYVDLVAEHRLTTAIRPQINSFLEGFSELIPRDLIAIFNDKELELLISGLPDIDLDDLRANTEYSGHSSASPVIQWFWEVVQCLSKEDKARLLQFVTGTSKVPLEGFSALQGISGSQKFQIHKAYGGPGHLPSAHTCFNQLDLPEYPSKEQLEERLLLAIHEANEGFGFG